MKKIYILFLSFLFTATAWSQSPEKMSYQAVIRDSDENLATNQTVGIQISILQGSASGTAVYVETQQPATNDNGLVTLEIGTGTVVSGDFASIDWSDGPYFLKTETDPTGGSSYSTSGTCELMSVPFALYAQNAGNVFSGEHNDLTFNGTGQSVFIGKGAGTHDDLSDNQNVFTGDSTGFQNTDGHKNTALGFAAFFSNTGGYGNTATGYRSLYYNSNGNYNIASGYNSMYSNTSGNYNIAIGGEALFYNTVRSGLVAVGHEALHKNAQTISDANDGVNNTAVGYRALHNNTVGFSNTGIGNQSLINNTEGGSNTAVGNKTLFSNTTGSINTAVGNDAMLYNTSGYSNAAMGHNALFANTTGTHNTAIGCRTLKNNTTGSRNTAVGYYAGPTSGNDNLFNTGAFGYNATVATNNTIRIGDNNITSIFGAVGWGSPSDGRFKTNVTPDVPGLEFITKLKPVTFNWDLDALNEFQGKEEGNKKDPRIKKARRKKEQKDYTGFVAQEVEKAAEACGYDFSAVSKPPNDKSTYHLTYSEFVVPLVKAVQEQQKEIENLENKMAEQDERIESLIREIEKLQ